MGFGSNVDHKDGEQAKGWPALWDIGAIYVVPKQNGMPTTKPP